MRKCPSGPPPLRSFFFASGKAPPALVSQGKKLLSRRFWEMWRINRTDITDETIALRQNLVMLDGDRIAAWLGIEESGELTNACVERGYHWRRALKPLIRQAFNLDSGHGAFAYVPVEKLASAYILMESGMIPPDLNLLSLKTLTYPERSILLFKLIRRPFACAPTESNVCRQSLIRLLNDLRFKLPVPQS